MVSAFPMQSHYRSSPSETTRARTMFDEDHDGFIDDSGIDRSTIDSALDLSPAITGSRRESFTMGPSLFSPKTEDWQSVDMQSVPSNSTFIDQNTNNPFLRMDHDQSNPFTVHNHDWAVSNEAASAANFQTFDRVSTDFEADTANWTTSLPSHHTPFAANAGNIFANLGAGNQSIPTSPQKDWMSANQSMAKKMRPNSPTIRSHNDLRRGDGIRKKNARFDIPAERNLSNIDHLIAQSTDEQEVKELKQQKRLLRNRQAALDSRQRKKQHTERLEDEKKHFTSIINDMEDEMTDLKNKMDALLHEKQSYADYVETLTLEKDEMIRSHTIETGELRKKVGVLTDHVQRLESSAAVASVSGSNAFSGTFDEMDGVGLGGAWSDSTFFQDYPIETEVKHDMPIIPVKKMDNTSTVESEKNASQGGLLFMLFLVGAFVMSSRTTPAIPRVSEDVRAASATLLDNVLRDAGVNSQSSQSMQPAAPLPSGGASWATNSAQMLVGTDMNMEGVQPSMLEKFGESLIQPTEAQTNDQIFSLSAAQYNGINDQGFLQNTPSRTASQGRKNLAEALATMRVSNKQSGSADVYTRSLLWDQIPGEVVRNFAKMVADCNNVQNKQQCNEATS